MSANCRKGARSEKAEQFPGGERGGRGITKKKTGWGKGEAITKRSCEVSATQKILIQNATETRRYDNMTTSRGIIKTD